MGPRATAALILFEVAENGRSLSAVLPERLDLLADSSQRALTQELCYGALRWYPRLRVIADQLLDKPVKQKDHDILYLLIVGLYQLLYMRIPPHAVVAETVNATNELGKSWAKGLVNAILRNFQRRQQGLIEQLDHDPGVQYAHPQWLVDRIRNDWPADWPAILSANNQRPPMILRVNQMQCSRDDYLQRLAQAGIVASPTPHVGSGVLLERPVDVGELPGFNQGMVSVQDSAAQLAAPLLDLRPGQRILDACAAPGGKTCHILESQPDLEVIAIDNDADRLRRVEENLRRLQLNAQLITADAALPDQWSDGRLFDRILLDAPCSASGVIRRHPDIKLLRKPADIERLAVLQRELLAALWPLLASGGMLLYITCSILAQENSDQMEKFLASTPDAEIKPIDAAWGRQTAIGRQILPGEDQMDGFYYACLMKRRAS